jgi:hypothetical protein
MPIWHCPGCHTDVLHDEPVGPEQLRHMQEPSGRYTFYANDFAVHQCQDGTFGPPR